MLQIKKFQSESAKSDWSKKFENYNPLQKLKWGWLLRNLESYFKFNEVFENNDSQFFWKVHFLEADIINKMSIYKFLVYS